MHSQLLSIVNGKLIRSNDFYMVVKTYHRNSIKQVLKRNMRIWEAEKFIRLFRHHPESKVEIVKQASKSNSKTKSNF